jgi:hypothetical protein
VANALVQVNGILCGECDCGFTLGLHVAWVDCEFGVRISNTNIGIKRRFIPTLPNSKGIDPPPQKKERSTHTHTQKKKKKQKAEGNRNRKERVVSLSFCFQFQCLPPPARPSTLSLLWYTNNNGSCNVFI